MVCAAFRPILFSRLHDTPETIVQVKAYNAAFVSICGAAVQGEWIEVGALAVSAAAFGVSLLKNARLAGADQQRVTDLEKRVDDLEGDMRDIRKDVSMIPVLVERVTNLQAAQSTQTADIKHDIKNLRMVIENAIRGARAGADRLHHVA